MIIELVNPQVLSATNRAFEITTILSAAIVRTYSSGHNATDHKNKDKFDLAFCQESAFIPTPLNMQNRSLK